MRDKLARIASLMYIFQRVFWYLEYRTQSLRPLMV